MQITQDDVLAAVNKASMPDSKVGVALRVADHLGAPRHPNTMYQSAASVARARDVSPSTVKRFLDALVDKSNIKTVPGTDPVIQRFSGINAKGTYYLSNERYATLKEQHAARVADKALDRAQEQALRDLVALHQDEYDALVAKRLEG